MNQNDRDFLHGMMLERMTQHYGASFPRDKERAQRSSEMENKLTNALTLLPEEQVDDVHQYLEYLFERSAEAEEDEDDEDNDDADAAEAAGEPGEQTADVPATEEIEGGPDMSDLNNVNAELTNQLAADLETAGLSRRERREREREERESENE